MPTTQQYQALIQEARMSRPTRFLLENPGPQAGGGDYIQSLEAQIGDLSKRALVHGPEAMSSHDFANELLRLVSEYTDWKDKKSVDKAKKTQQFVLKIMHVPQSQWTSLIGPNARVDTELEGRYDEKAKVDLVGLAHNQIMMAHGLGVIKPRVSKHLEPLGEAWPSLGAIELLGIADSATFTAMLEEAGFWVATTAMAESQMEPHKVPRELAELYNLAVALGYIVQYSGNSI